MPCWSPSASWSAGRISGGIALNRLRELTKLDLTMDLPPSGARNLNEWVVGHLGRAVHGGEILKRGNVRIVVRKVRRHKVLEAQVERIDLDEKQA